MTIIFFLFSDIELYNSYTSCSLAYLFMVDQYTGTALVEAILWLYDKLWGFSINWGYVGCSVSYRNPNPIRFVGAKSISLRSHPTAGHLCKIKTIPSRYS